MGLEKEIDETRIAVCNIMNWLLTVTLHQKFGVGSARLDRITARVNDLMVNNMHVMETKGTAAARKQRKEWVAGAVEEFRVPLLRAPKTNRERQLVMAGNAAATISWQVHCKACADVLGFGEQRLQQLKKEVWKNYEQFNEWSHQDGTDVAMEMLRRCVQQALRENVNIVESDKTMQTVEHEFGGLLERYKENRVKTEKSAVVAKAYAIQKHTMLMNQNIVLQRCDAELKNVLYCNGKIR